MFGNLNKPAFGSTAPNTSFGFAASTSTPNPFGQNQNLFGKPAAGAFGSTTTSTFGQPANTSLFPATQAQPTNLFQNANTTFGTAPSTQSGFGSNLFGQPQQSSAGGLFNTSSTFGQQNKPTGFGFGSPQPQPSLFGQQPQQPSTIFQTTGSNLFGGTSAFGTQQSGTVIKFNPVTGTDTMLKSGVTTSINTKHHSITCMKEYENKSFEELRFEDYQGNRKGPQQQASLGSTPFGATASSASSFYQPDASKPAFGQVAGFGQTASTFGQNTTGFGLGTQQNTAGGLFGSKPPGFGLQTTSAGTGFGFGASPQNANPFGAAQPAKPFGNATPLFGSNTTQQTTTGFGTGLFGQTNAQNTGSSLFNKPAQPTTGFGTTGQTTGFSFNTSASTQSSSLFGSTKPLLSQSNSTTGFGNTNTFGTTQTGFSSNFVKPATPAFGTASQNSFGTSFGGLQNQGSSLFGNTQAKPGGLFNSGLGTGLFSNTNNTFQNSGFGIGQQQTQQSLFPQQDQQHVSSLALLTNDPFGDAPHLAGLEPKPKNDPSSAISATDPKELKSLLDSSKKVDMSQNSKLRIMPLRTLRDSLFEGVDRSENPTKNVYNEYTKTSCRRLILKPRKSNDSPSSPGFLKTDLLGVLDNEDKENTTSGAKRNLNAELRANPLRSNFDYTDCNDSMSHTTEAQVETQNRTNQVHGRVLNVESKHSSPIPPSGQEENTDKLSFGDSMKKHPSGIICTRPEYYTLPSLEALAQYVDENGHCIVKGFTIGRRGYGNVYFPDEIDVAGLNIDELVHFRYREINVYPDESKKPPVDKGLNRKAQVTLDNVYPRRSGTNTLVKDVSELLQMNFAERLRKITEKKDARFVDYRPETGSWVFKVDHFSKYSFNDSDEENDENGSEGLKKKKEKTAEMTDLKAKVGENLIEIQKQMKEKVEVVRESNQQEQSKYGLDKDILVEEEDHSSEDDMLHHSMYVDNISEDDYHQIPTDIPTDITYDSYKTTKNIQVMKSTLFADDDRSSDGAGSHMSIIRQYLDIPDEIVRLPILHEEMIVRKRPVTRPKVWKVYNFGGSEVPSGILPSRCCLDLAMFKGKSYKAGWSKGFNFFTLNTKQGEVNGELTQRTFEIPGRLDPLKDVLIDSLKIVLEESVVELSDSNVPTFKISKGHTYLKKQTKLFDKLAAQHNSKEANYLRSIWSLCTALWGPSEDTLSNRRYLLSEWLKSNTIADDLTLKTGTFYSVNDTISAIFTHLSVFKILEAASIAMDNRLPNLALLISQLSLSNTAKLFLQEQIESWYNSMTSAHIAQGMKSVYLLLSGIPIKDEVNIFTDVDWKRAFGMHLWYVCPNGAPVEMAIELYKKAFEHSGYAIRPSPPHMKSFVEDCPSDVLYHILLLYKSKIHRLSSALNPATHTEDPLDYRLSWLLLQLFLSIEIGLIETSEKNKLCTSFANQLEELGHWEWAIFTLLHLEDNIIKKNLVIGIIERNLDCECDEESIEITDNLVNHMHIPPEWIHTVKAEKSLFLGRYYEAFNHFSLARDYVQANDVFIKHILPNLFINEQFEVIKILIDKIKPGAKNILRWNSEAGLFLEFLELQDEVISFRPEVLLKLQMQLGSISERISSFPLNTDQQKLCIAEMSKRCASLYKELCEKSKTNLFKESYTQFVDTLIMPPDFKQNEGLYLINYFYNFKLYRQ